MEVHKPKPIHGWRELVSEVGVIVIGIAIALSGEQLLEALHWRHTVGEGRSALKQELGRDATYFYYRLAVQGCLKTELNTLESKLAQSGNKWTGVDFSAGDPKRSASYAPTWWGYQSEAWRSALANGVASHMPNRRCWISR